MNVGDVADDGSAIHHGGVSWPVPPEAHALVRAYLLERRVSDSHPDSPLFTARNGGRITPQGMGSMLRRLGERTAIALPSAGRRHPSNFNLSHDGSYPHTWLLRHGLTVATLGSPRTT
jgi:hypothetical protein